MREFLFRGKRTDNGEQVEGFYSAEEYNLNIRKIEHIPRIQVIGKCVSLGVIPQTVGQYTGLTDKNDRKIFEGDIVEHDHPYGGKSVHTVIWNKYGWNLSDFYATYFDYPVEAFSEGTEFMTVIGNIYDNPELMKGGNNNG